MLERDAHCRHQIQTQPKRTNNACPFRPGTNLGIYRPNARPQTEELASTGKPLNLILSATAYKQHQRPSPQVVWTTQSSRSPISTSSRHGPSLFIVSSPRLMLTSRRPPQARLTKRYDSSIVHRFARQRPHPSRPRLPYPPIHCARYTLLTLCTLRYVEWQDTLGPPRCRDPRIHHPPSQTRARPLIQEACSLGRQVCRRVCTEGDGYLGRPC